MPKAGRPSVLQPIELAPAGVRPVKLRFRAAQRPLGASGASNPSTLPSSARPPVASRTSVVFKKGHGQHILRNPLCINAIVEKAGVKPTDIVLEIGPGTGNLTEKLLHFAKRVIAFEIDPQMVAELHKRFDGTPLRSKLEVICGNCLHFDFPYFDKCVANVPYSISSPLVFKLLKRPTFKCAVLMLQREFALRICAKPGTDTYCRLSVNCQLLAKCNHMMKVGRNSFNPPPKVDSSVIRLDPLHPPPPIDFDQWDGFVKMIFNRKNKKVSGIMHTRSTFKQLYEFHLSYCRMEKIEPKCEVAFKAVVEEVLQSAEVVNRRPVAMDQGDILVALNAFNRSGVYFA